MTKSLFNFIITAMNMCRKTQWQVSKHQLFREKRKTIVKYYTLIRTDRQIRFRQ